MVFGSLIPSRWGRRGFPARREEESPIASLQREMNRLFDDFFRSGEMAEGFEEEIGAYVPSVDMTERDNEIRVTVELPGLSEKDVEVLLSRDSLTIRGEKRSEEEEEAKGYYRMERIYGSFQRTIPLPCEIESDKVDATFKNGVLSVTLPKTAESRKQTKSIPVKKT